MSLSTTSQRWLHFSRGSTSFTSWNHHEQFVTFFSFQNCDMTALATCVNGDWGEVEELMWSKLPATITTRFTMPVSFINRQKLEKQIRHALVEALNEPDA
eukprot:160789_1